MKRLWEKLKNDASVRLRALMLLGLLGIGLIALSEFLPRSGDAADPAEETASAGQVEQALEERITALIRTVDGVGDCQVMVTLENGVQYRYAADSSSGTTNMANDQSQTSSEKILTVQTDSGLRGLLLTEIQPSIRGVAVVCGGGNSDQVVQKVTRLITTAFNLSARRVCVISQ